MALENPIVAGALLGALGGLIRAVMGVWKSRTRGGAFRPGYFVVTIILALLIGTGFGLALESLQSMKLIAFLGGYGGTDFLEGLTKSVLRRR